ncbi:MAG: glycoside hydrolase family 3 C-terminal domain-containing protein [Bacteroidales bacterium]|nr:glycoside hydrolase family 3 C-terminal domain-containing protein [Bacteroidales bacterium]
MKKRIVFLTILTVMSCNVKPSAEEKAAKLIEGLTIEEKASLMMHPSAPVTVTAEDAPVKEIPAYNWWNEALHGVARNGKATTFPQPIGMAASFDDALLLDVFTAVSDEARVKNRLAKEKGHVGHYEGLTFWTPNINIFRDPRWGRGMETYGEDPYLTGRMGVAVVNGLQGDVNAPVLKAHACAKHFAVHSGPEWNRHTYNAEVSERDLRETYFPAFKDLVVKAHVQEVMIAYNRFRGVPCGASDYLINTILRGEWGYKGLITSDCWAIKDFTPGYHNYSPDKAHAAAAAIHAGTDLNCGESYEQIPEAVANGLLDEADVDRSLLRLLTQRFRLGEMENLPTQWDGLSEDIVEGPEHLALARRMARESLVLIRNDGILPLAPDARIAVVGPNADEKEMLWGNYNPIPEHTLTLLEAIRERSADAPYVKGCRLVLGTTDVPAVLDSLSGYDTVIFAGGISPHLEGEEMKVSFPGFKGGDRTSIELPQVQRELIAALHEAGKKVVLVNFSGSAMGLVPETSSCDAILQAWYPGEEGAAAIAEVLYGDVNPSGKLPVTFYKNVDQLPDFEDYTMEGHTYRYFRGEPLFPFGYGLSYTTFEYGEPRIKGRTLEVSLTNTGSVDGVEVVQLYTRLAEDTEGPVKSLRGFQRVPVKAGETVKVRFKLTDDVLLSWSADARDMVPTHGTWEFQVGGSSASVKTVVREM